MTVTEQHPQEGCSYEVRKTETRGRAVYATQNIPSGTVVHFVTKPYVCVIRENFKKEVCAWCFKYKHGKSCSVKHPDTRVGVNFCSVECLQNWLNEDEDGELAEAWAALRSNKARKVTSS